MTTNTTLILKSLADDTRLSIVRKLAQNNCEESSSEIVSQCSQVLALSQPAMSHHFNRLVQAGIIIERKVGTEKHYKLNYELLTSIGINPTKL